MTQNVESLVLDVFDWLERVERFQKLLLLAMEQLDNSNGIETNQFVEILLERYMVGVEPCFDEISVLKSTLLNHLSVDSLGSFKTDVSESSMILGNSSV